ncbi:DUF202 domain-containing protein [uncultured Piscinibacter sp.]|uniref:YidH family protein n=1 Tax=uncultured Piscinibacter sp. TaxID=1131835 RepID=UPI002615A826|nr:DUF202 domain-containing protein [uncultured Piscinibacter sp.]
MTSQSNSVDPPQESPAASAQNPEVMPEVMPEAMSEGMATGKPTLFAKIRYAFIDWIDGDTASMDGKSADELAQDRTDMAARRTLMAADRTLMAWLRTSLSMLSFGFTIYKVLQAFQETGGILPKSNTPRNVGLFLTGMGTFAIVIGTIEYWQTLKELRAYRRIGAVRPPFVMAVVMSITGVTLFFSIITKMF